MIARWGSSGAVLSWQIFNEMDGSIGGTSSDALNFLGNITAFIKANDPHHHLVTNSYAEESGLEADDKLPTIDYTTTHAYESGDLGGTLSHYASIKSTYGKPTYTLVEEGEGKGETEKEEEEEEERRRKRRIAGHNNRQSAANYFLFNEASV